jgi:predicted transposase/invertase (TIGR01784 family)
MSTDYIKAYSDIFIKYLFGKEGNEDILLDFINDVLTDEGFPKITELTIKNPFNPKEFPIDKDSYLDIKVIDETGKHYNIEVQSFSEQYFLNRILYYWSKLYSSQIKEGESYGKLKAAISINVLNFEFLESSRDLHNLAYLALKSNLSQPLTDLIFVHFIELPKLLKDKPIESLTDLERWIYFFVNEGKEGNKMEVLVKGDEPLYKAHKEYERFTHDDKMREIYEMRVEGQRRMITNIEVAKEEGKKESSIEIAKNMLKDNIDISIIQKYTGLSENEIEKLKH